MRKSYRVFFWSSATMVVMFLLFLFAGPYSGAQAGSAPTLQKFDAALKMVLDRPQGVAKFGAMIGLPKNATSESKAHVLIQTKDGGKELQNFVTNAGGVITSSHGNILAAQIPVESLAALDGLSSVVHVEGSQKILPELNQARTYSTPDEVIPASTVTGVNVNSLYDASPRVTGRGVLIGIIDTGVDVTLSAFKTAQGNSRILYHWYHPTDTAARYPTVTTPEGTVKQYSYGSEYTASEIDAGTWAFNDPNYHGTHVAGIAAARENGVGFNLYRGMAPESRLLVVSNTSATGTADMWKGAGTGRTLDAYEYLLSRARQMDLPLVVNQSQNTLMGPHDGTTLFEQALQWNIQKRNLIPCISAGNNRSPLMYVGGVLGYLPKHHSEVLAGAGGSTIEARLIFDQYDQTGDEAWFNSVDCWFDPGPPEQPMQPQVRVNRYNTAWALLGQSAWFDFGSTTISSDTGAGYPFTITRETPSTLNYDNHYFFTFTKYDTPDIYYYGIEFRVPAGSTSTPTTFDFYVQRNTSSRWYENLDGGLQPWGTLSGTVGMPGSTPGAITVGSYNTRLAWEADDGTAHDRRVNNPGLGEVTLGNYDWLSNFSSVGPMRDPTHYTGNNQYKPDICAPGAVIVSQASTGASIPASLLKNQHLAIEGTSMSSPMVTGIVALLLQENPAATADDIKTWLHKNARHDASTDAATVSVMNGGAVMAPQSTLPSGPVPNNCWGYGKVDAQASFEHVVSGTPLIYTTATYTGTFPPTGATVNLLAIYGRLFASTAQIYLNGNLVSPNYVYWVDHKQILVDLTSYGAAAGVVRVKNPKGGSASGGGTSSSQPFSPVGGGSTGASTGSTKGGCFIATAAYGSYMDPHVATLREYRDTVLEKSALGRSLVDVYYRFSPAAASVIAGSEVARGLVRTALTPVVFALENPGDFCLIMAALMLLTVGLALRMRKAQR